MGVHLQNDTESLNQCCQLCLLKSKVGYLQQFFGYSGNYWGKPTDASGQYGEILGGIWSRDRNSRSALDFAPQEPASKSFFFEFCHYLSIKIAEFWQGPAIFKYLKLLLNKFCKNQSIANFYLVTQPQFSTKTSGI